MNTISGRFFAALGLCAFFLCPAVTQAGAPEAATAAESLFVSADSPDLAIFPWGNPQFSDGLVNTYPRPAWVIASGMEGGLWVTNDTWYGWQPALVDWQPELSTNRLLIQLDRNLISSNLLIAVAASGDPDALLLASFYDIDLQSVIDPITLHVSETPAWPAMSGVEWRTNTIDLAQFPTATILTLTTTNGLIRLYTTILVNQKSQISDLKSTPPDPTPSDRPTAQQSPPSSVSPSTVLRPTVQPAALAAPNTWHVNALTGLDAYDGTAETYIPSTTTGPRQSITAALTTAAPGDTINVAAGTYGKTVKLNNVRLVTKGRVVLQ